MLRQDTLLLYNPKECGERKKVCPFFLLENSRPLSPWGPLDSLPTCLGNVSLTHSQGWWFLKEFILVGSTVTQYLAGSCLTGGLSCGHSLSSPTPHAYLSSFWQPLPPLCTLDGGPEPSPPVTMEPLVTESVPVSGSWETWWRHSLHAISP